MAMHWNYLVESSKININGYTLENYYNERKMMVLDIEDLGYNIALTSSNAAGVLLFTDLNPIL